MIQQAKETLVVIGNGLASGRLVEEIQERARDSYSIVMFGDEPFAGYDRIQLSGVLGGFVEMDEIVQRPFEWYEERDIRLHAGVRAERIDLERGTVTGGKNGRHGSGNGVAIEEPFDRLILATGARPLVPAIAGTNRKGVFVFRTLADCASIATHAAHAKRAVVIGGGLLGLEAARALLCHRLDVTVLESAAHLMPQQLDMTAGAILRQQVEALGIKIQVAARTCALVGENRVEKVQLADGSELDADLVVISCGTQPNVELASAAGLAVRRGIVVDDRMQTSALNIYAVGECAEHRGVVYGLAEPVLEQAHVLAGVLTGSAPHIGYAGSRTSVALNVLGIDLVSLGEVHTATEEARTIVQSDPERGHYHKLVVRDGKLAGAILLGDSRRAAMLANFFRRGEHVPDNPLELLTSEELLLAYAPEPDKTQPVKPSKIELMKEAKDGLDTLPDILRYADSGNWREMTEDDKQRFKWHGLFFRKQTPGHFMLRLRMTCGFSNASQFRVIADLSDEFGKGFCDLTTRQQIQMRWFTIKDLPEMWRRLDAVGLHSKQTGMDNIRGVCGCPLAGATPHELIDASPVAREFTELILDNKEFTNLPRKFNVTITGCLENCCHTETQDVALVPSYRELDGQQVNGFNLLVGGKQGSGGYQPAQSLDVFVPPQEAAELCGHVVRIFRDFGNREQRTRARLAFLLQDRGVAWFRAELERRWGRALHRAGPDLRKKHHVDHLGIHPQKAHADAATLLHSVGLLVPVGRITSAQMRGVADLAERYGNGAIRLTVQQNLVIPNIPQEKIGALSEEPIFKELPFDPSPVLRGLVSCVGSDYCHLALIETKGWAVQVARELEERTRGHKLAPLTIHWSGCSAGCGLHQVSTIGLQGCRSRVNGQIVDAAHVCVNGKSGPEARIAADLMYDVPCDQLAGALEAVVKYLPRQ